MWNILKASLLLAALAVSGAGRAEPTEISFYFPIAVGGPVAKSISALAADFEKRGWCEKDGKVFYRYDGALRPMKAVPVKLPYKQGDGSMASKTVTAYLSDAAPAPSPTWTLHGEVGRRTMLRRLLAG